MNDHLARKAIMSEEKNEHGIQEAVYAFTGLRHEPCLVCLCGESFIASTWEEAGADLDNHLSENE